MATASWRWLNQTQEAELRAQEALSRQKIASAAEAASANGGVFVDAEFPRDISSIDGRGAAARCGQYSAAAELTRAWWAGNHRREEREPNEEPPEPPPPPTCTGCGDPAKLNKVSKAGPNQGREFWGCPHWKPDGKHCTFFRWALNDDFHSKKDLALQWQRMPNDFVMVGAAGFKPAHIRQGGVGDCWFLAALAVVAERGAYLLSRNVLTTTVNPHGHYLFRLFIDGFWRLYSVDDHLPVRKGRTKRDIKGQPPLAYSKATDKQLWVPLLEKAYAKAHGSFRAISGGWIAEALWDLTGFPTESISFTDRFFDSELTWARLLSFRRQGFLMGIICPASGDGLVGMHAYSVLDVRELTDVTVGQQPRIDDFFTCPKGNAACAPGSSSERRPNGLPNGMTAEGTVRLVRIRNPWGQMEWKGAFGARSVEWTASLRKQLDHTDTNDGTFWMSWHDVLSRFSGLDICKTHEGWYAESRELTIEPGRWCAADAYEVRVEESTWVYMTICQPNKRGKAHRRYYYSDLGLLVLRNDAGMAASASIARQSVEMLRLSGECRLSHNELMLDPGELRADGLPRYTYTFVVFSIGRATAARTGASKPNTEASKTERTHAANLQTAAPFTLRLQAANVVEVRVTRRVTQEAAAVALHEALADLRLPGVRATVMQLDPHAQLLIREGAGAAMALVVNRSLTQALRVRMLLHGALEGACSAGDVWHSIPPNSQVVVEAIKSLDNDDYESLGSQTSFALDRVDMERPAGMCGGTSTGGGGGEGGSGASACALFAPQQITVGSAVAATARLPGARADAVSTVQAEVEEQLVRQVMEESLVAHGGEQFVPASPDHDTQLALAIAASLSGGGAEAAGGGGGAAASNHSHKRKQSELDEDPALTAAIAASLQLPPRHSGTPDTVVVIMDDTPEVIELVDSSQERVGGGATAMRVTRAGVLRQPHITVGARRARRAADRHRSWSTRAAADTEQLPFDANYDPAALEAYYSKRPLQLYSRVLFVTRNALTIAVAWARDEWAPSAQGVTRGKVLRDTIATMGPVFVKLGQTLSTRPDIIGQEACDACGQLQDQMPPFDSTQAFDILSRELQWAGPICPQDKRTGLDTTVPPLFRHLTTEPVSAASLGQVYRGVSGDGEEVAVKVQRPGLLPQVALDLYILRRFLVWYSEAFSSVALTPPIADSLGAGLFAELDYRREAANARRFAAAHADLAFVAVPRELPALCTRTVLTTQWVRGRPMKALSAAEKVAMARMSVECSVAQLLSTGVLHADPHEGNLLYGDDGRLYFLDFGLLSLMEQRHMEGMASGILHLLSGEWVKLMDDFGQMEVFNAPFFMWDYKSSQWDPITEDTFRSAFTRTMEGVGADMQSRTSFGELFVELGQLAVNYQFTCPAYYVLVMRSFVTLEGVAARADSSFNIYTAAVPYAVRRALTPRTPYGRAALREALLNADGELRIAELRDLARSASNTSSSSADFGADSASVAPSSIDAPTSAAAAQAAAEAAAKVTAVLKRVLLTSEGAALRRTLADAASIPLAAFLTSWHTVKLLFTAAWSGSGAAGALATDGLGDEMSSSGKAAAPRSTWSSKALWAVARAHVRKLLRAGPRGWLALCTVAAVAVWLALVRQLASLRPRRPPPAATAAASWGTEACDPEALPNPAATCAVPA